ncbi:MAG: hypothetical protein IIW48_02140 [Clostridia bacterium]|nr:hypothetical protein [Clostridia bacterium]
MDVFLTLYSSLRIKMQKIPQQHKHRSALPTRTAHNFRDTATYAIIGNNILSRLTIVVNQLFIVFYIYYIYRKLGFVHIIQNLGSVIEHIAVLKIKANFFAQKRLFGGYYSLLTI